MDTRTWGVATWREGTTKLPLWEEVKYQASYLSQARRFLASLDAGRAACIEQVEADAARMDPTATSVEGKAHSDAA